MNGNIIISVKDLKTQLGKKVIHNHLDLEVRQNTIIAIVGDSGCGKTTLMRVLLMLQESISGEVCILGHKLKNITKRAAQALRLQWGVMFQNGALFNDFTVLENILFPIKEFTACSDQLAKKLVRIKLLMCGLPLDILNLYPYQLSGGMIKRTSVARAIALDPQLLFLDEPTSGLDPNKADEIDELILSLKNELGLTIVMITHDLNTLAKIADKIFYISNQKVIAAGTFKALKSKKEPEQLYYYFNGNRAKEL